MKIEVEHVKMLKIREKENKHTGLNVHFMSIIRIKSQLFIIDFE